MNITSARAEASFSNCQTFVGQRDVLILVRRLSRGQSVHEGILVSTLMHFSSFLMIVALVVLGVQLAYALYQLVTFVL
jgi:hypothetical protein